jgi:hypothetical protein
MFYRFDPPKTCHLDRSMTVLCHAKWRDPQFARAGNIAYASKLRFSPLRRKKRAFGRDDKIWGNQKKPNPLAFETV